MIQRQRRVKITSETKKLIFGRAMEQPRIQRTKLAVKLQVEIKRRKEGVPQLEVLERMISHYRNHAEDDPQEKPWDLRTLNEHWLPPESLPAVIEAWMELKRTQSLALSIRQAKWVSWLYPFYEDRIGLLYTAITYSWDELLEEMVTHSEINWQSFNVSLYQKRSEEKLPKGFASEITKGGPITGFGVEYIKKFHPYYPQKPEKQEKAKEAQK